MTEARTKELADLLPVHVLRLANAQIGLSLMDWGEISSDIMEAARILAALSAELVDDRIGKWLSAALEDSSTCVEMKADIEAWFASRAERDTDVRLEDIEKGEIWLKGFQANAELSQTGFVAWLLANAPALIAAAKAAAWRPIETAPRDGTKFLAVGGGCEGVELCSWCERVAAWDVTSGMLEDSDHQSDGYTRPTHWRPIGPLPGEG